jgi:hypothetical protein
VEQDFPMGAGNGDIVTEMAPRPHFFSLPVSDGTTYLEIRAPSPKKV